MRENVLGMILKGYPRISETFISNEIALLEAQGIDVHIISMRHPRESFTHRSVERIKAPVDYLPTELFRNLHRTLPCLIRLAFRNPTRTWATVRLMSRRLIRSRKLATVKHLLQAAHLVERILPGSGITHLHAHFAHSPTSVTLFASSLSGLPMSFTAHAKDVWTQKTDQLREKISLARFVITCTEYNRAYLSSLGAGDTPIHRVYHGIDLQLFSPDNEKEASRPPYRIMTVARLAPKKGLPTVFRALKLLRDRGVPFTYCLIGDGDDREKTIHLLRELQLEDITSWLGSQPHEVVLREYERSDAFVIGCQVAENGDRDGIPNVLVEAMAMRVPVVATSVSAIPELVTSGDTGFLVQPGDEKAMADALEKILTGRDLRNEIIPAAQEFVRTNFDNRVLSSELVRIFHKAGLGDPDAVN